MKGLEIKIAPEESVAIYHAPREIRTLVLALKGLRPGPLDDGGERRDFTTAFDQGQALPLGFILRLMLATKRDYGDLPPRFLSDALRFYIRIIS